MEKYFLTVKDVSDDLNVSMIEAKELIKSLNDYALMDGYFVVSGSINKRLYEQAKAEGFTYRPERYEVPVWKRDMWSLDEFVQMCNGAMGKNHALKFLKENGLVSRNGKKVIVNRIAFEEWCKNNPSFEI